MSLEAQGSNFLEVFDMLSLHIYPTLSLLYHDSGASCWVSQVLA